MANSSKMGAPTKYDDKFVVDLISYFDVESYVVDEDGRKTVSKFPTMARFALNCGVHVSTLHDWATQKGEDGELLKPDFSEAYKKAKLYQEAYLYECGLAGAIDKTFGIWATKTILGHREPEKEVNSDDTLIDALSKLIDKLPN